MTEARDLEWAAADFARQPHGARNVLGYGIPFPSMRERLERPDEACQVIRSLWTERRSTFTGRHYQLSDAPLEPRPVQTPHPRLMIGGGGERVTLRLVATHADACNFFGGPKVFARKGAILRQGLRERGYEEGRNLVIEYRWAERKLDRSPVLATELVRMGVDIIDPRVSRVASGKQATSTIPIVIAVIGDPVTSGMVAGLSHPDGNVTGLVLEEFESTKWPDLLKRIAPRPSRIG
jgi:hypothetical protein